MKKRIFSVAFLIAAAAFLPACNSTQDATLNGRLEKTYGWKGSAEMPGGVKGYEAPTTRQNAETESAAKTEAPKVVKETPKKEPAKAAAEKTEMKIYTVQAKDTLSSIAMKEYKKASAWEVIFNANKDLLKNNPDRIFPGMKLNIPVLKKR